MNLKKCSQGHFYDEDKDPVCPQCKAASVSVADNAQNTFAGSPSDVTMRAKPQTEQENTQKVTPQDNTVKAEAANGDLRAQVDDVRTVGMITNKPKGKAPVAGWLVCVDGKHYGEDFRLTEGRNFIGRGRNMDVVLANDISVSREKHAVVIYEPNENVFHLTPGESSALCYLNGKVLLGAQTLRRGDIIQVGRTKLAFIPLCAGKFRWKTEKAGEDKS